MSHTLVITKSRAKESVVRTRGASASTSRSGRTYVWSGLLALLLVCILVTAPLFRVFASEVVSEPALEEVAPVTEEEIAEEIEEGPEREVEEINLEEVVNTSDALAPDEHVQGGTSGAVNGAGTSTEPLPEDTVLGEDVGGAASTTEETDVPIEMGTSTAPLSDVEGTEISGTTTATTTNASSTPPTTTDTMVGGGVEDTSPVPVLPDVPLPTLPTPDESSTSTTEEIDKEATTTPTGEVVNTVTNDENRFSFGTNECISVGDGTFYCTESSVRGVVVGDSVFAALDSDGDKEIYLRVSGSDIAITNNQVDDDAPFYDQVSDRVVWHGVVNDRSQIFSYDLDDRKVVQLTDTSYNNMQATAYGEITLWQAWIGNDWEIVMDDDGEITQLTDNEVHDVMPRIRGDYVLWQSFEGDAWRVKVLDRKTGIVDTIEGDAGASAENPRFVLVYDSKKENGDVETLGYDFDSREVVPLASTPTPVSAPERVPEPEESGEERALVQQSAPRTEVRTEEGSAGGDGDGDDDLASSTPGSSSGSTSNSTSDIASSTPAQTDFDLVIPEMTSSVPEDTQDEVASSSTMGDNEN